MAISSQKHLPQKKLKFPLARVLIIFSILIIVLNALIVVHRSVSSYGSSMEDGKYYSEQLIHKLSDHIELTFLAAALTLRRAVERNHFNQLFGNNLLEDMRHNFMTWVQDTPQITAMLMTDANGRIRVIHRNKDMAGWLQDNADISGMSYFDVHLAQENPEYMHTAPATWNGKTYTLISRRLSLLDGGFGGVVMAAINNDYFLNFFNSIETNRRTTMAILREDHKALVNSQSAVGDVEQLIGIASTSTIQDNIPLIAMGDNDERSPSLIEDVRIYALERISQFNIYIGTVTYGRDIFGKWREARLQDAAFFGMFALFALVISLFATIMSKQMQRVEASEETAVLASQAKSEFLANMSHELRTPLNAIIGFSEMLETGYFGKLNAKQKERVTDINLCGYHLLELINDILEFSKGEAGKIELNQEKMHVHAVLVECTRIMQERAKMAEVTLSIVAPDELPYLYADSRKIKQILLNLLSNAVKFTPRHGTITVDCTIDGDGNFVISVADTGIGMAPEDIPKALSVFGQVHKDATYGGTGLGLPLCKMFAELHGGTLSVESQKGLGTTVYVVLPASRVIRSDPSRVAGSV